MQVKQYESLQSAKLNAPEKGVSLSPFEKICVAYSLSGIDIDKVKKTIGGALERPQKAGEAYALTLPLGIVDAAMRITNIS